MKQLDGTGMKRLHREWRRRTGGRLALVLDGVQGPFNVGAIIRTAAALRADHLWLAGARPVPGIRRWARPALGTERYLSWTVANGRRRRGRGGAGRGLPGGRDRAGRGGHAAARAPARAATCLVVGHEDRGIPASTLDACDDVAYLPQLGKVGSLNVATAASIACYEVRRQEWTRGETPATAPGHEA
jgi:tRNA (guanosine-2'-O-)-methyltransferase